MNLYDCTVDVRWLNTKPGQLAEAAYVVGFFAMYLHGETCDSIQLFRRRQTGRANIITYITPHGDI
jgi:hypothetical protein